MGYPWVHRMVVESPGPVLHETELDGKSYMLVPLLLSFIPQLVPP